MCVFVIMRR